MNRTGFVFITSISLVFITGCSSSRGPKALSADLTGTQWNYTDNDWSYAIAFLQNGKLSSEHPNDQTPDNDQWEQKGKRVTFYFNNKFSSYYGIRVSKDTIRGVGNNAERTWKFILTRIN